MADLSKAMRAYDPVGWCWHDRAEDDHPAKPIFVEIATKRMLAALAAYSPEREQQVNRLVEAARDLLAQSDPWRPGFGQVAELDARERVVTALAPFAEEPTDV